MSQLSASSIDVRFGHHPVLSGVNLSFGKGCVTAIVGPNGAGKSTLMDCLAGIRRPTHGQITLDARDIYPMPARQRARAIAYLPQQSEIAWAVDGETLVALGRTPHTGATGLTDQDHKAIQHAMAATQTTGFRERLVTTLSGGERARLLIARAMATDPQWLLADEPLAGLDPKHALDAMALFHSLAHDEGRGVIITLHDLNIALRLADRVIVLAKGKVVADDEPQTALSADVMREAYGISTCITQGSGGSILEVLGHAG